MTKASSWADAVAKAKSYILVAVNFTYSTVKMWDSFVIPKEEISGSKRASQGYYYNSSVNVAVTLDFNPNSCGSTVYTNGTGATVSSACTFYYD